MGARQCLHPNTNTVRDPSIRTPREFVFPLPLGLDRHSLHVLVKSRGFSDLVACIVRIYHDRMVDIFATVLNKDI